VEKVTSAHPISSGRIITRRRVIRNGILAGSVVGVRLASATPAAPVENPILHKIRHRFIQADGVNVFYREAGPSEARVLLLLHGLMPQY
jgi:hypothetical protein